MQSTAAGTARSTRSSPSLLTTPHGDTSKTAAGMSEFVKVKNSVQTACGKTWAKKLNPDRADIEARKLMRLSTPTEVQDHGGFSGTWADEILFEVDSLVGSMGSSKRFGSSMKRVRSEAGLPDLAPPATKPRAKAAGSAMVVSEPASSGPDSAPDSAVLSEILRALTQVSSRLDSVERAAAAKGTSSVLKKSVSFNEKIDLSEPIMIEDKSSSGDSGTSGAAAASSMADTAQQLLSKLSSADKSSSGGSGPSVAAAAPSMADTAQQLLSKLNSAAEVSPSDMGVPNALVEKMVGMHTAPERPAATARAN